MGRHTCSFRTSLGALALVATGCLAQAFDPKPFRFEKEGTLSSGIPFSLRIAELPLVPLAGEKPERVGWWGADGDFPRTAIQDFQLTLNGKDFWFPEELYRDLGEVNEISVSDDAGYLVVTIIGGDAAGSYSATFRFSKYEVERTVRVGEFPDSAWERTTYHNSLEDDVD